jgi:hypothetical protein
MTNKAIDKLKGTWSYLDFNEIQQQFDRNNKDINEDGKSYVAGWRRICGGYEDTIFVINFILYCENVFFKSTNQKMTVAGIKRALKVYRKTLYFNQFLVERNMFVLKTNCDTVNKLKQ